MRWLAPFLPVALLPLIHANTQTPFLASSSQHTPTHSLVSLIRSLEVSGSITRESTAVTLSPLEGFSGSEGTWVWPVEGERMDKVAWVEAVEGKQRPGAQGGKKLKIEQGKFDSASNAYLHLIHLPSSSEKLTLTVNTHYTHLTTPKPARLSQADGEKQGMEWNGDLLGGFAGLRGALNEDTVVVVKFKTPTPKVFGTTAPEGFTVSHPAGSATVTYTSRGTSLTHPQIASVHYAQPSPVMAFATAERLVEVSHWGSNVAIEDKLSLQNVGPELKGTFSRLAHQQAAYTRQPGKTAHVLSSVAVQLPAGSRNPYYTDIIGNVSTSRFRPSTPPAPSTPSKLKKRAQGAAFSFLELMPRYPIMGGWKYDFTIGWDMDAAQGGVLMKGKKAGEYVLRVGMFAPVRDIAVDSAVLKVRLPEGSKNVNVYTPFPVDELEKDLVEKTYLDTTGRPTVRISKTRCSEQHGSDVYITYERSALSSLQKPAAVFGWGMVVFLIGGAVRRFDARIGK